MDKDERREIIVQKARELCAKFGYKKTTMDDIAFSCGIGKTTLYYYFKSKEEIFKVVINKEFNEFKDYISKVLSDIDDPHDKLKAFILNRAMRVKELANFYSTLKDEYLEHYAFIERERQKFTEWEISVLKEIIEDGIQKGIFKEIDPKTTAVVLAFALKGLEYPWVVQQTKIELEKAVDMMLPVFFEGIDKK